MTRVSDLLTFIASKGFGSPNIVYLVRGLTIQLGLVRLQNRTKNVIMLWCIQLERYLTPISFSVHEVDSFISKVYLTTRMPTKPDQDCHYPVVHGTWKRLDDDLLLSTLS